MASKILFFVLCFNVFPSFLCRKHTVKLVEDTRKDIEITNFGFFKGGSLLVNITNLTFATPDNLDSNQPLLGFTLDRSNSHESASYAEDHANTKCVLKPGGVDRNDAVATVYLTLNFTDPQHTTLDVNLWGKDLWTLKIVPTHGTDNVCYPEALSPASSQEGKDNQNDSTVPVGGRRRRQVETPREPDGNPLTENVDPPEAESDQKKPGVKDGVSEIQTNDGDQNTDGNLVGEQKTDGNQDVEQKTDGNQDGDQQTDGNQDGDQQKVGNQDGDQQAPAEPTPPPVSKLPVGMTKQGGIIILNTSFVVCIQNKSQEGLYSFIFHQCKAEEKKPLNPSLTIKLVEKNVGPNYLSAGDFPLPTLYTAMSVLFFCSAVYWIYYLCHQPSVFKIHYLMFFLALIKSLSLMFHAVDYHFIAQDGIPMEAFEILFYITYLTKGALLFGTIVLIGSGWAFIKPILSDNDKKLFWIVIPLQILANVAYIIIDSSEEALPQHSMWKVMFVTVDIICCGAILYPVIWSIRHLQDAAHTDGKAAISLVKLKLFRSYYVLVVCYIYFSRIVVYLLTVTMPFQFMWLDKFFFELAAYVFYIVTAYKFRPGTDNPYLQLPSDDEYDDDDMEMEEVISETGMSEGVKRIGGSGSTRAVQRENHSA